MNSLSSQNTARKLLLFGERQTWKMNNEEKRDRVKALHSTKMKMNRLVSKKYWNCFASYVVKPILLFNEGKLNPALIKICIAVFLPLPPLSFIKLGEISVNFFQEMWEWEVRLDLNRNEGTPTRTCASTSELSTVSMKCCDPVEKQPSMKKTIKVRHLSSSRAARGLTGVSFDLAR